MTHTIEFWKSGEKIQVEYNLARYELGEFLRLPDTAMILDRIYDKIVVEHQDKIDFGKNRLEIIADFIEKNFLDKDNQLDVIILGNGTVVKFNLEGQDGMRDR